MERRRSPLKYIFKKPLSFSRGATLFLSRSLLLAFCLLAHIRAGGGNDGAAFLGGTAAGEFALLSLEIDASWRAMRLFNLFI